MPSFPQFSPTRIRSYLFRLPFCTRLLVVVILGLWIATIPFPWIREFGRLEPAKMDLTQMHRLNLYPVLHLNFFHMIFNLVAVTPLVERFESEYGTLVTLVLFTGPFGTIPGGVYTLLEKFVLRSNTIVMGASIWVFLLLSAEVMKTQKTNPYFSVGPYRVPTWTTPLMLVGVTSILVPNVSLIGHLCGAGLGYLWASGYIKFLVPHEKILRWLETKLNLLARLPHYVSVDQKTYGRYGVLPTAAIPLGNMPRSPVVGDGQRLGP
ncbi:hypothetical protein IAQ61_010306 [Plenodomus lingam]|nr:hypothetical protein IAQ61_010306 [Plenodomus lingam]